MGRRCILSLGSLLLLLCAPAATAGTTAQRGPVDPPDKLYSRFAGLVVPYGYPCEEHFVETVDGYILRMFRIPHGRAPHHQQQHQQQQHSTDGRRQHTQQHPHPAPWLRRLWHSMQQAAARLWAAAAPARPGHHPQQPPPAAAAAAAGSILKPVVHIQHGLLGSSTDFVLNRPGNSLPLMLADAGFDVWFGNVRGNVFSRNHTALDSEDAEFWQFSWDEMASRDLPAMLTHELMVTGVPSLAYVGHSQGTTIGMAFLSSHAGSALAERINVAVLLAPVAFVTHMDSIPMNALATLDTDEVFTLLGFHEFMPSSEVLSKLEGELCQFQPYLCVNLLSAICGYNPDNLDVQRLPTYLNYTPSGTSVKNMAKWAQAVRQQEPATLRYFDYGTECRTLLDLPRPCNQAVYGQVSPPTYNLSAIQTHLVLFTGGEDILADPVDTALLLQKLPLVYEHHHERDYGHLDFVWGYNARHRVYDKVLDALTAVRARTRPQPPQRVLARTVAMRLDGFQATV